MTLKLYNTLTRKTEEFKPLVEGRVGIYVCGPTVYGHAHLGHAKSYVSFDILVRYLRYLGYSVTYVQNITDVGHLTDDADAGEDKIVVAARKEKKASDGPRGILYPKLLRRYGQTQLRPARYQPAGQRPYRRTDRTCKNAFAKRFRVRSQRLGLFRCFKISRLRETFRQKRRGDARGRTRGGFR